MSGVSRFSIKIRLWNSQELKRKIKAVVTAQNPGGSEIEEDIPQLAFVRVHLNFRMFLTQKFRLRGIDCPEINTPEGKRAKRFVEERLKGVDFIVIKTHKDTTDKYERYLADIFYLPSGGDADRTAREGHYLNQDLLDARLARLWQD